MLPLPNLIVAIVFIIMGLGFLAMTLRIVKTEDSIVGKPSIHPFLFYSGKVTMFLSWGPELVKAIDPSFFGPEAPLWMRWAGTVVLCAGTLVLLLSFFNLCASLKYGLPDSSTQLKTSGLYRYSRHPLYLGVFLLTFSSMIYFPNIINILIGAWCISTHYMMIIAEERFLADRFGLEWEFYKKKVRRFL